MNKKNMENYPINNNPTARKKYNPLKDANFWVAFVLGGGYTIFQLISSGALFNPILLSSKTFLFSLLINLIFLIVWETWIILRKGGKGSLVLGFVIALIVALVLFFSSLQFLS